MGYKINQGVGVRARDGVSLDTELRHIDLPSTPSSLLRAALRDLRLVEQSGHYKVDMGKWHQPSLDGSECSVCLAGALLSRHLKIHEMCTSPDGMFDADTMTKLMAVDMMRVGCMRMALHLMGIDIPKHLEDVKVPAYDDDPAAFRGAMDLTITRLLEHGL